MGVHTPRHHPAEEWLIQHAAGQLDVASRVLIEAHLSSCLACSQSLASHAEPGRRWLEEQPVVAAKPSIWESLSRQIEDEKSTGEPLVADLPLPMGARGELPDPGRQPRWRKMPLSSARFALLYREPDTGCHLAAVRIPGGRTFPRHEHLGAEDVVVLTGAFRDEQGHFQPGDFQHNPSGTRHAPEVDPGEPCWIVARYEAGIRFFGLRGLLLKFAF